MEKSEKLPNLDENNDHPNPDLPDDVSKIIFSFLTDLNIKNLATISTLSKKWHAYGKKILAEIKTKIERTQIILSSLEIAREIPIEDMEIQIDFMLNNDHQFEAYHSLQNILNKASEWLLDPLHDTDEYQVANKEYYEDLKKLLAKKFKLAGYVNNEFIGILSGAHLDKICSFNQKYSILLQACIMKLLLEAKYYENRSVQTAIKLINSCFASDQLDYLTNHALFGFNSIVENITKHTKFVNREGKIYLGDYLLDQLIALACGRENIKEHEVIVQARQWIMDNGYLDEKTISINKILALKNYASTMPLNNLKNYIQHLIDNGYTVLAYKHLQELFTLASDKLLDPALSLKVRNHDIEHYENLKNLLIDKFKLAGRITSEFIKCLCSINNYSYEKNYDALMTVFIAKILLENAWQNESIESEILFITNYFKNSADLSYLTNENGFSITIDTVKNFKFDIDFFTKQISIGEYLLDDLLDQACKDFPKEQIIQSAKQWLIDNGYHLADNVEEIQTPKPSSM